ncbi:MAG: hypothetical protein ACPH3N_12130 [Alcanivorax sediminis]|uniref:Uncharacterized protein n=1 Tax=Alcanivorax sediminis TaxID=2663008 RepID=A0A6N7M018_9GAMM|nr:hypothetical protein [Alcanivorax sediminis]MQX54784.1 hypothetical protein [Alcanivorax sediminis]
MSTTATDHRWLMQYNIVNLVNQCRRLIRAEFDANLSLTDPELRHKLAHYAGRTRSQGMQRLYGEIRLALIELEGPDELITPEPTLPVRFYRGQPVEMNDERKKGKESTRNEPGTGKTLMYRGRAVVQH